MLTDPLFSNIVSFGSSKQISGVQECTAAGRMSGEEDLTDQQARQPTADAASWFPSIPAPVKRVFDRFPLAIYAPNELPSRSSKQSNEHKLYIFTTDRAARHGSPSFNPQCLKWQAYLKFAGIQFQPIPSNNHASPNGVLPYLLPTASSKATALDIPSTPIPSNKLRQWTRDQSRSLSDAEPDSKNDAYTSLIDNWLRNAWLYTLYLDESNFESIARKLYVAPATTNSIVRTVLSIQLRDSARNELLKCSPYIDVGDIYASARKALDALSSLLGDDQFFFGKSDPGLFDASLFAYTHLILDESLGWKHNPLATDIKKHDNLVQHRERIFNTYF